MEFKVIKESAKLVEKGEMDTTVVLEELQKGDRTEYVTHVKLYPKDAEPYTIWGHYFVTKKDAEKDYKDRCKEYKVAQVAA